MIKKIFAILSITAIMSFGFCETGEKYKEKMLVEGLENLCEFSTDLNASKVKILDSRDGKVYLQITASDEHYGYFEVDIKDGKLVIKEKIKTGKGPEGKHVVDFSNHPFAKMEAGKYSGFYGGSIHLTARQLKFSGYLVFDDGTYWEPSFVKIYRPRECRFKGKR